MNVLRFKGARMFVGILFVLIGVWIISAAVGAPFTTSIVNTVTYPIRQLTNGAAQSLRSEKSVAELAEENDRLQQEINSLQEQLVNYYDIQKENEQFKKYYNIKSENADYQLITASVIAKDDLSGYKVFTLNKGITSSVKVNNPVLTEKGLVGWVSEADITSCSVTTILSEATTISVIDKRTSDTGILTSSDKYAQNGQVIMTMLNENSGVAKGDVIVTSGIGGVFPANLRIGVVSDIQFDEFDTYKYAVITPYEDINNTNEAVVITDIISE